MASSYYDACEQNDGPIIERDYEDVYDVLVAWLESDNWDDRAEIAVMFNERGTTAEILMGDIWFDVVRLTPDAADLSDKHRVRWEQASDLDSRYAFIF
jgi:hypothetical protein